MRNVADKFNICRKPASKLIVLFCDTMGYNLQAFICKQVDSKIFTNNFDKAKNIEIEQGLCLIPMTEELFDQINDFVVSGPIDKFEYLTDNIEDKILQLIDDKKIAYVEADYFGGEGGQNAIIWNNKKREFLFGFGQNNINKTLQHFGVITQKGKDEFETIGLGQHRNTNDWVEGNK